MVTWTCAVLLLLSGTAADNQSDSTGDQTRAAIVVRPAAWSAALSDWKAYRQAQGHEIIELDAELGPRQIQQTIARLANSRASQTSGSSSDLKSSRQSKPPIGYVVLMGDGDLGASQAPLLPAWYRKSTAMVKLGGDKELATDAPYGDIDSDECPDLAVGRIPADTPQQLKQFLARTVAYERLQNYGTWRRDVRVVAGVGGFGAMADSVIEMTTSRFLTDRVPAWADVAMTYASPNSPYCPDPWQFCQATVDQLNAGSMFWVYVGHGHVKHLDFLQVDRHVLDILDQQQVPLVQTKDQPPIAVFLACYTGAFDAREDCISEQLVLSPQGPVAALAATRVTGPYGLATLASGMLDECYVQRNESLGDALLCAKRRMLINPDSQNLENTSPSASNQPLAQPPAGNPQPATGAADSAGDGQMQLITALAAALSPAGHDLAAERQEHVWQMNLLGDPLLRLHHPQTLKVEAPTRIAPGEVLTVSGVASHAGSVMVELARSRDRTPRDVYIAGKFTTDVAVREKMQATYAQVNQRQVAGRSFELPTAGPFTCDLQTDATLPPGRYVVRVFVAGRESWSAGSADLSIRATKKP